MRTNSSNLRKTETSQTKADLSGIICKLLLFLICCKDTYRITVVNIVIFMRTIVNTVFMAYGHCIVYLARIRSHLIRYEGEFVYFLLPRPNNPKTNVASCLC